MPRSDSFKDRLPFIANADELRQMLFSDNGFSLFALLFILGGLGKLLIGSLVRLQMRERLIYRTACFFGTMTGLSSLIQDTRGNGIPDPGDLTGPLIAAIFVAFTAMMGWYFVVAVAFLAWEYGLAFPFRAWRSLRSSRTKRNNDLLAQKQARQEAIVREEQQRIADDEKRMRESATKSDRQIRDDARFACQLFYDQHAVDLEPLFSQLRIAEYFNAYMSDEHSVEQVKLRGEQLQKLLTDLLERNGALTAQYNSILEIKNAFDGQRQSIANAGLEKETEQSLLAEIARDEQRTMREFHER